MADALKCLEIKEDFVEGYLRAGMTYFQLNKIEEPETEFRKGLKYTPKHKLLKDNLNQREIKKKCHTWKIATIMGRWANCSKIECMD